MLKGTRFCLVCGECINREGLSTSDVMAMDPILRQFDRRFNLRIPTKYVGNWPKSGEGLEKKYEKDAINRARQLGFIKLDAAGKPVLDDNGNTIGDPVRRLLEDEWLARNWSQRPTTTTGSRTVWKWMAAALAIKNAATGGSAATTDMVVWAGGNSQVDAWQLSIISIIIAVLIGLFLGCSINFVFKAVFRCCVGGLKGLFDCDMKITIETRTVGVQSQTTYDRDADPSRFKAYENGFRRQGEVTIGWQPPFL